MYCEIINDGYTDREAVIWKMGGAIGGCHQPFTIIERYYASDSRVRVWTEKNYPGIEYAPVPQVINGRLYP